MDIDELGDKQYNQHKGSIITSIQRIIESDQETYADEFRAFIPLMFDLFSDASPDAFVVTDGKSDQGIDAYTHADGSYEIFQCKFADLSDIEGSTQPLSFDKQGVLDIETAFKYLTSSQVVETANREVKKLRGQIAAEGYENISFNLCVFGNLTIDAQQKFDLLNQEHKAESDKFTFRLITWRDIILQFVRKTSPAVHNNLKFRIHNQQILSASDYCYFIGHAKDFRDAFQKYSWSLFDLNVRSEITKSKVNKQIIGSITRDKTRRRFHHLNNGLLLICKNYSISDQKDSIVINDFQVINGCQTVVSIYRGFEQISNDKMKVDDFDRRCFVQIKAIQRSKETMDLVDQIIISTNNQNPMSPRNLKSNTEEQKVIKNMFHNLPKRWFYQRKDGEFDALKSGIGERSFRKEEYRDKGSNTYRVIDNQDIAKTWTCFCGLSSDAMKTNDFFVDDRLYNRIFKQYPTSEHWNEFLDPEIELKSEDELFEIRQPSAEEYLLSYLIWGFIKEYSEKPTKNREQALKRGAKAKKLTVDARGQITDSQEKQADYLVSDTDYMINNIIGSSREVLLEMYSFILTKKYGTGHGVAKAILEQSPFSTLVASPDFKSFVNNMDKSGGNVLFSIYEFLKLVLKNLYPSISGEYVAASRRKSYLARPYFVQLFKNKILEMDNMDAFKGSILIWKDTGKSFLESMPS